MCARRYINTNEIEISTPYIQFIQNIKILKVQPVLYKIVLVFGGKH
jgi:hypothetical protein